MKIASNTPASFYPRPGYEFIHLGDNVSDVSIIVLMLEKNWGGGSVDKIKALSYWLSLYPKKIPCYIIGCESTIPDREWWRYRHKERDDAIRSLCDEVLIRSKSIGVRGEITYEYLTVMLGYDDEEVDIIYYKGECGNANKLSSYLENNNCPLRLFEKSILRFQSEPRVWYERPIGFEKEIIICQPAVTEGNEVARLSAGVRIDGELKNLWCETDKSYRHFLLSERADAFLCVLLPHAMRAGKDIICEAPITEHFLHNLNEILIPQLVEYDRRLYKTKIKAFSDSGSLECGSAVATGMSCGVDSFYTAKLYHDSEFESMKLSHLYCGNYLYGNDSLVYDRASLAAKSLGLPLVSTKTNINEQLNLPHLFTHFFKTMFGVLALKKLFSVYYYSSASDFGDFTLRDNSLRSTAQFELLLLYTFSCSDFQIIAGGVKSNRLEKTEAILNYAPARSYLNVCLYPDNDINCGKCGKCMRTLLMIDMLGGLDYFGEVFDIKAYRESRLESFIYLVKMKKSIEMSKVYKYFLAHEPRLVKQAEVIVDEGGGN